MRPSSFGWTLALALLAAPLHAADTKKDPPADVGNGRIAWFDLATTDIAKSKAFYTGLFGWTYTAVAYTDLAAEIVSDKTPIGTLRTADGAVSPFNGVVCPGGRHRGELCESEGAGRHHSGGVSVRPAGWDRGHRVGDGSGRRADRDVFAEVDGEEGREGEVGRGRPRTFLVPEVEVGCATFSPT
ncbi:MAG: hypothetical protein SGI90_00015 [Candidatus Eisenbacteria bacterium]|nr:hypothetical protein [Candidatus Eisenbacteria bacterium]